MCGKIGIVSPIPHTPMKTTKDSSILWFSEMEAAWAFLLNNRLDTLYINPGLENSAQYQKKFQDLHHDLIIEALTTPIKEPVTYFPTLEEIFSQGKSSLFQPIVTGDLSIHGFECLSRFVFDGMAISPEFVFNYAQEKLMVAKYDRICIELSLSLAPNQLIFINVRPQTLVDKSFTQWLTTALKKYNRPPHLVVLEVTEQHCNISEQELIKRCLELKDLGLKLAIDDFGSGLANLSLLEMVKPHYLKISGRFSKNIHQDQDKQKIIKNILDLANVFAISAVVECVESLEEWLLLKKLGVSLAQGFHFFKPMTSDEIKKVLG